MGWYGDEESGEPADPSYIDRAFKAMELEQFFDMFNPRAEEVTPQEYELICVVKSERARYSEFKLQQQQAEAARASKT